MSSKLRDFYDNKYVSFSLWFATLGHKKRFVRFAKQTKKDPDFIKKYKTIALPYWKKYGVKPGKNWFKVYWGSNDSSDPRFIPNDLWLTKILPHYNTVLYSKGALQDKCLHNLFIPNVRKPVTVCKNVATVFYDDDLNYISREEAIRRCREQSDFIVKPSVGTSQGYGISFYNGSQMSDKEILAMFDKYERNFIIQEIVRQHPLLASLNESSLNTVRVISFFHKGKVHVLSAILRVGGKNSRLDNVSQGGYQCTIKPDGSLEPEAYTYNNGKSRKVTQMENGIVFGDFRIPSYQRILDIINANAPRMGHFKILGWDFSVDESGEPVMIEYNTLPGQNQMTCGPTLGDLTEEVLKEVFLHKGR